jgi:pyridoxamine 5'-phosphate oxidase family protein
MTLACTATPTRTADVIVVGSGPGGLSAAVYAHRLGEKVAQGCGVLPGPKQRPDPRAWRSRRQGIHVAVPRPQRPPLGYDPQTRTWACPIGSTGNSKPLRRKSEMSFAQEEIAFIKSQRLARIATVDDDGQPDVVPVGFEFDGTYFNIGGLQPANTRRHHNVSAGNHKVALVIDEVASTEPWSPRFLRIYGTAEVMSGEYPYLRVTPTISWSSNLSGEPLAANHGSIPVKRTVHR